MVARRPCAIPSPRHQKAGYAGYLSPRQGLPAPQAGFHKGPPNHSQLYLSPRQDSLTPTDRSTSYRSPRLRLMHITADLSAPIRNKLRGSKKREWPGDESRVGAGEELGGVGALVANTSHLSQKEEKQDKKAPNLA